MSTDSSARRAWLRARALVLQRDHGRCQHCGSQDDVHVHHIRPRGEFDDPQNAHDPSNLVTLCPKHHGLWEGRDGRPTLLAPDDGLRLRAVTSPIGVESVLRLAADDLAVAIVGRYLFENPAICNRCFGRRSPPTPRPIEYVVAAAAEGEFIGPRLADRPGDDSFCSSCYIDDQNDPPTRSADRAVEVADDIVDRLDEQTIPCERVAVRRFVEKAKRMPSLAGRDHDVFRRGARLGVRRALQSGGFAMTGGRRDGPVH